MIVLTEREKKVHELVVLAYSNKQIARKLDCSEQNIKAFVSNILKKRKLENRTQLIVSHYLGRYEFDNQRKLSGVA